MGLAPQGIAGRQGKAPPMFVGPRSLPLRLLHLLGAYAGPIVQSAASSSADLACRPELRAQRRHASAAFETPVVFS